MGWPDRLEMPGGVYHVGWRGVLRGPIFLDDGDRTLFRLMLRRSERRLGWRVLLYCLMTNHLHLLVETPKPNLSLGMQRLGSAYARRFNAKHGRRGHVFEQRFWSSLVKSDRELELVAAYIHGNPVTAGLCDDSLDWPWLGGRLLAAHRLNRPRPDV
jgi:putative transposase